MNLNFFMQFDVIYITVLVPDVLAKKIETYRIDHHYPGSENKSKIAVLYGELGTMEFSRMHNVLREFAKQGELYYVLRHYVKVSTLFTYCFSINIFIMKCKFYNLVINSTLSIIK